MQRHWDGWQRNGTPVTLILSGSALRLMEELLAPGAPLYGRADYRPLLEPLDFRDASLFASPRLPAESKLRRYAVLGGTPQYQVWAGKASLMDLIADRILSRGESLYEEPLHLLREEQGIREPGTYFAIVREVAAGRTTVSEIANGARVSVPNLTKMLRRLVELGYLEARAPLAPQGPEARRSSYRLADPFFRFWFRFVFPNRSLLERGRVKEVLRIVERDMDSYMAWPSRTAAASGPGALRAMRCPPPSSWAVGGRGTARLRSTSSGPRAVAMTCSRPASGLARRPPPPSSNSSSSATRCPGPAARSSRSSPAASPPHCAGARTRRE